MGATSWVYRSKKWQKCRAGFIKHKGGLCERCLAQGRVVPGDVVHHKIRITPENMHDPTIVLNWNNLELLCRTCHEREHGRDARRFRIAPDGKVVGIDLKC